jgi:hypothetical protein
MKTFDEAIQRWIIRQHNEDGIKEFLEYKDSYSDIVNDAVNSKLVFDLIEDLTQKTSEGLDLRSALFAMFLVGLKTGIDMEKSDDLCHSDSQ